LVPLDSSRCDYIGSIDQRLRCLLERQSQSVDSGTTYLHGQNRIYASQTILYTREIENKDYAEVDTKILTDKREELSINYKLHSVDNEWKVYDLVIEDISVVSNYRSQFDRVIARSSFEELVRSMKEKQS
jgi:phospholipid transport system substrate-binding protein